MRVVTVDVVCDSNGDATEYGDVVILGAIYSIVPVNWSFDSGVDYVVTSEGENISIPILTGSGLITAPIYPRVLEALNTDGSALTTHTMPLSVGRIKVVIANGGGANSGSFKLYVIE